MEDILLLQAIERYLDRSMLPAEKAYFEELRKNTPEIDQMVVEHNMFLHQMEHYSANRNFKGTLYEVHARLLERGEIGNATEEFSAKEKVIRIWSRYRKVTAIAACAGGVIALVISALAAYLSPVNRIQIQQLSRDMEVIRRNQQYQGSLLNEVKSKLPENARLIISGSGFLIDPRGYIITNAHVLKGSGAIVVNRKGEEFHARIIHIDAASDLAILQIDDEDYTPFKTLPYTIRKSDVELGDEVFTLGYPRNDITYNKGDLSAKTGYDGDTTSMQIQMSANPGNSGGPVFNRNAEVIGVLSTREIQAEGVTFAIKSRNIYRLVNEFRSDSSIQKIHLPSASGLLRGRERSEQIKQVEDCVFQIKAYNDGH